jgi:hypothetical protein
MAVCTNPIIQIRQSSIIHKSAKFRRRLMPPHFHLAIYMLSEQLLLLSTHTSCYSHIPPRVQSSLLTLHLPMQHIKRYYPTCIFDQYPADTSSGHWQDSLMAHLNRNPSTLELSTTKCQPYSRAELALAKMAPDHFLRSSIAYDR